MMRYKILVVGNGFIADNFIFKFKDDHYITVYARNKNIEYDNVAYVYGSIDCIENITNDFDCIYILFGYSRPSNVIPLSDMIYTNVYLVSKILEYAYKNSSKIFYPATSLALPSTSVINNYTYSHLMAIDIIKRSDLNYTICYLHNIYGNLSGAYKKNKMVVDNFIDSYQTKQPVQLINNGSQKRIFTHISDVINFMITSISFESKEVNLVKNNNMYSIKELADLLELSYVYVNSDMYTLDDPYVSPIGSIDNWSEQIDIKHWLLTDIKK